MHLLPGRHEMRDKFSIVTDTFAAICHYEAIKDFPAPFPTHFSPNSHTDNTHHLFLLLHSILRFPLFSPSTVFKGIQAQKAIICSMHK